MELKVGQVFNSRGRSVYGMLIRLKNRLIYGRKHNWAHSAIITDVKEDKILVHEALTNGFIASYHRKEWFKNKLEKGYFVIGEAKVKLKNVLEHAKKYEGKEYGFFDIVHIIIYWIFGTEAKFLFTHTRYLICSEAVARILYDASGKKINFESEFGLQYDLIEPMHLWQSKQIRWLNNFPETFNKI